MNCQQICKFHAKRLNQSAIKKKILEGGTPCIYARWRPRHRAAWKTES